MQHLRRSKRSLLLELLIDSLLLLLWIPQIFLICCLLIYGHVPIPRDWLNSKLEQNAVGNLVFQAQKYRLQLNGNFEAVGLKVYSQGIEKPIIEAESALVRCSLTTPAKGFITADEIVLADGTMHVPAVYAPNGKRTPLLEGIAVDVELRNSELLIRSICAQHEDVSLRGAFSIPLSAFAKVEEEVATPDSDVAQEDDSDPLSAFYDAVAKGLSMRSEYRFLTEPTLSFDIRANSLDDIQIEALLSSPQMQYGTTQLSNASVSLSTQYADSKLTFRAPTIIETESLEAPDYDIRAINLSCQVTKDDWDEIFALEWPSLELSAQRVYTQNIRVDAPFFKLWRDAPNVVGFKGSAEGLSGAVNFEGAFDVLDRDGWIGVDGSIDLYDVLPEGMKASLPELAFRQSPHYNVDLSFGPDLSLERAYFDVTARGITVDDITFDQVLARGRYSNRIAEVDSQVYRGQQAVAASLRYNHTSGALDVMAKGTVNPQDYSPLLPRWWGSIFEDFTITKDSEIDADFIIQSNLKEKRVKYFYGSVDLQRIEYNQVPIENGFVVVRGTGRYIEVHLIEAEGGEGSLEGAIAFALLPDGKPSPVSLHLDVQLELTQAAVENLLGEVTYRRIVGDFDFKERPYVTVEGVSFYDKYYPQLADKSYYYFSADSRGAITYNQTPLDYLKIQGYADNTATQLRNVQFGYAKGNGTGDLDIFDQGEESDIICFKVEIVDADEELAIANLPALDEFEEDFQNDVDPLEGQGRLNANLHAIGPIEEPYELEGYGDFRIQDKELGSIQMLGPLSKVLQGSAFGFTSFELDTLTAQVQLSDGYAHFPSFRIDGPRTQINALGNMKIEDQSLDMRVSVRLFGNATSERNPINRITSVFNPLAMLLRFRVTGTMDNQRIRSTYDPRNLLPGSKK